MNVTGATMEYEHKGVTIKFDEKNGDFDAQIGPRVRTFPSLAAAKKAVDADKAQAFEPFDAIVDASMPGKLYEIARVIGIERATGKRGWTNRDRYVLENREHRAAHSVLRDTPENRAAFVAYREYSKE